ncbi:MAG TPA: hypothetical protein VFW98_12955 [Gemmatimonadaceae bacterium]|nr:hypothetical protein [Gemmatimonadaceae bacterium]
MHRHWVSRVFTALLTLWFAALVTEPVALHPCPMHDALLVAQAEMAVSHGMRGMAPMRGHVMMTHGDSQQAPRAPQMPTHHQCTCLGTCTAADVAGLPGTRVALAVLPPTPARTPILPEYQHRPAASPHILPFAHAPPLRG